MSDSDSKHSVGHGRATAPLQGFLPFGQTALAFPPALLTYLNGMGVIRYPWHI